MAINLTADFVVPNGRRVVIGHVKLNDEDSVGNVRVELRTASATDHLIAHAVVTIRNGKCDRVKRQALAVGGKVTDALVVEPNVLDLPAGFDDLVNAWRAGATPEARRGIEAFGLTAGWIDPSLTGT